MILHPWQDLIAHDLASNIDWRHRDTVTVRELMTGVIGIDMAKINAQGMEAQRVGQIMQALGWSKRRRSQGAREWEWVRPLVDTSPQQEVSPARAKDAFTDDPIPF